MRDWPGAPTGDGIDEPRAMGDAAAARMCLTREAHAFRVHAVDATGGARAELGGERRRHSVFEMPMWSAADPPPRLQPSRSLPGSATYAYTASSSASVTVTPPQRGGACGSHGHGARREVPVSAHAGARVGGVGGVGQSLEHTPRRASRRSLSLSPTRLPGLARAPPQVSFCPDVWRRGAPASRRLSQADRASGGACSGVSADVGDSVGSGDSHAARAARGGSGSDADACGVDDDETHGRSRLRARACSLGAAEVCPPWAGGPLALRRRSSIRGAGPALAALSQIGEHGAGGSLDVRLGGDLDEPPDDWSVARAHSAHASQGDGELERLGVHRLRARARTLGDVGTLMPRFGGMCAERRRASTFAAAARASASTGASGAADVTTALADLSAEQSQPLSSPFSRRRPSESARLSMELDPHVLADDELAEGGAPDNSAAVITALLVGSGPPSPLRSADRHRASGFAPPPTPADGRSPRAGRWLASAGACSADGDGVGPALQCAWADEVDGPERLVDASVSAERRFPPERVGAFSCHGARELNGAVQAKVNQDCALVCYPFGPRGAPYLDPLRSAALTASRERTAVFCVLDGHGAHGEVVSREVGPSVCALLQAHPRLIDEPATALVDSFAAAQALLDADTRPRIGLRAQSRDSGACCTLVLLLGDELWTANLGDCRAVLGCAPPQVAPSLPPSVSEASAHHGSPRSARSSISGSGMFARTEEMADGCAEDEAAFSVVELSFDHKVEREDELARVRAAGGQVQPAFEGTAGQYEPARLFEDLQDFDAGPGLTMTRAFGDWGARSLGFSHEPEVTRRALRPTDRFLILASDGVWEFIDSALAVEIVGAMYESGQPAQLAALSLITAAANRWYAFEGPWYRDDITCVVVYLDDLLPSGAQAGDARGTSSS
ncbi:hypothetical protein KFE25_010914 [Diacronema lutheri]|uniref:PPM-type phosphatase domain-containing protein n=2 Tax=Diacronema lutheri TaxID=2081491 RepID=A0A8J5X6T5_DIALT|nr:hypothetical protein KFE25_009791 [Diacronema lutheri]KAG8460859.1 hypothetical protein KFE25_010914 [Diacronema lutheri]